MSFSNNPIKHQINCQTDNQLDNQTTADQKHKEQPIAWQDVFSEQKIDILLSNGYVIFDELFSLDFLTQLQAESGYIQYQEAKINAGGRIEQIRGDKTHWITDANPAGFQYVQTIEALAKYCNRIFYAGIQFCEAHYARYPVGFGYQWHSDNPKGRDDRVLSAVFYLNNDWQHQDGGALQIIDNNDRSQLVLPKANRLILFNSDLQHQVQIAHRERFSIATWLRRA